MRASSACPISRVRCDARASKASICASRACVVSPARKASLSSRSPPRKRERALDGAETIGQRRREAFGLVADAVGDGTALSDESLLEHREPVGERLIDPIAMHGDRVDGLGGGVGEAVVEVVGVIADRGDSLLGGRIESSLQRIGLTGESVRASCVRVARCSCSSWVWLASVLKASPSISVRRSSRLAVWPAKAESAPRPAVSRVSRIASE